MTQLDHATFVCLDCETTGLDTKSDRIIEVAAIQFTFTETVKSYETLIDPKCVIPEESIKIHNIKQEMVAGKPTIKDILPDVLEFVGDSIIVGHGILFDIDVITEEAKRERIPCSLHNNPFFDTLRMARLYGESPTNSLEVLRQHFNITAEGAHRAMSDVIVNIAVFKQLCKEYRTIKQLQDKLKNPIRFKRWPLGKYKGRSMKEIPLNYLRWAVHKDFDEDLMFTIREEIKQRKKGNSFSQATNPFSSL